ncbi:hypothetical protein B4U37_04810 [Sutcliffiella horikoshii]|uniref:Uncharacterized protein n=1 Tax=Sutcliffiella horikoshii TaxID=79883 RepID=A0ABM6KGC3_9BACI|nr:hypothetical protein [Sutcliffiella horikoshii]ART75404.1 hypothetical protein B4U37_04810 [Sutcliffiella horikoshii]
MKNIDKRNRLDESPFSYRISKDNTIFLDYENRQVKILKGKEANKFLERMEAADDDKAKQLIMAKITRNFKRGNEKSANSDKQNNFMGS